MYHLCLNGTAYLFKCSRDLLFDELIGTCNYASEVKCNKTTATTGSFTASPSTNRTSASPTSSTASTSRTTPKRTVPTRIVSVSSTTSSTSTTQTSHFRCRRRNGLFRNPDNCGTFYQCSNWYPYLMKCPANLHYSEDHKRCDYPCIARCDRNIVCTTSTTPGPRTTSDPRCSCSDCNVPNPENCAQYYECRKGRAHKKKCPQGQLFDQSKGNCNWAHLVKCGFSDKCPMKNGLFPYEGDCHKFVHCSNGLPYVKQCPSNLEFDPVQKRCEWPAGRCENGTHKSGSTSAFDCRGKEGHFVDERNRRCFYQCASGRTFHRCCNGKLVFSERTKNCEWEWQVNENHQHHQDQHHRNENHQRDDDQRHNDQHHDNQDHRGNNHNREDHQHQNDHHDQAHRNENDNRNHNQHHNDHHNRG